MTLEQLVGQWDPLMASLFPGSKPLHRAAIWGQTLQESNCNPAAQEFPGQTTGGIGLWQHTGSRRRGLEAYAAVRGKPWQDVETQVRFVCQELLGDHAHAWKQIQLTTAVPSAAGTAMAYFEAPAHWQDELQKPGSTSARLDVRIKGTERALATILAAQPKEQPMPDTPTIPPSDVTPQQVDDVIQELEALGNVAISRVLPGAAPIIKLIEFTVVNPMLSSMEGQLASQINANQAAHGIFSVVMLGLGFIASKFLPQVPPQGK